MSDELSYLDFAIARAEEQVQLLVELVRTGSSALVSIVRQGAFALGLETSETAAAAIAGGIALLTIAALTRVLASVLRIRAAKAANSRALAAATRAPRRLGLAAVLLFAAVFGGWSAFAPLASAALAPGVISPDGHRKTIQHLEGGIVRLIHVREGDQVAVGQPLITLDDTRARALHSEIRERLVHLVAIEARLEAERTDAAEIVVPEELAAADLAAADDDRMQKILDGQRQLLMSRRATYTGRTEILEARIRQLNEQNAGLKEVIAAQDQQIALIDEEIEVSQELLEKGLERKPRVLALRRARADISAEKATNRAKIAENGQAIGEARLQLLALADDRQEKINAELADVRRMLAELRGQLPSREDILDRTTIRAPIAGIVMNIRATTESGVVGPGEPLLEVVPEAAALIIDARVRPTDIERVTPGMTARIVLTAYRQRTLPLITGTLRSISADVLTDERTGEAYYLAKVEVSADDLRNLHEIELVPGMPAEVMLMDGERSLVEYLLGPIIDSARRSLRES